MNFSKLDLEELRSLRMEIIFRIFWQNVLLLSTIISFMAATGVQVFLPAMAGILALGFCIATGAASLIWCHMGVRQAQIKTYLLELDQRYRAGQGWEAWLPDNKIGGLLGSRWVVSTKGVFISLQLSSILLGTALVWPDLHWTTLAALLTLGGTTGFLLTNPKERNSAKHLRIPSR